MLFAWSSYSCRSICALKGRNTLAQSLDIWSVWGESDKVENKYVRCVQLHCLLRFNMGSLRGLDVGHLSHWILWLVVCKLYDHSHWRCASESAWRVGGTEHCVGFVFRYTLFHHFLFSCSATHLLHLAQAQNIHTTVELAARRSGVFNATFLPNGSDKRQQSGRIKAAGCWFQSGRCVGALMLRHSVILFFLWWTDRYPHRMSMSKGCLTSHVKRKASALYVITPQV